MASVTERDIKALEIIVDSDQPEETKDKLMIKLGLNSDDIRAWALAKQTSDFEVQNRLRNAVMEKIRMVKGSSSNLSESKAVLHGGLQAVTFGQSDELIAAFKSGIEAAKGKDFKSAYAENVKKERQLLTGLEEQYPLQYLGSEVAVSLAMPTPFSKIAAVTKAQKIGKLLMTVGTESVLMSAGKSQAQFGSKEYLKDIGQGTAGGIVLGGAGGGLLKAGGKMAQAGKEPIKKAAKVLSAVLFDLPFQYTEKILNPRTAQKILNPKNAEEIVDSITDMLESMHKHSKELSHEAAMLLSSKKDIPLGFVVDRINQMNIMKKVNRSSMTEANATMKKFEEIGKDLANRADENGMLSARNLKEFIQDLEREIPFNKNEWKLKDSFMGAVRSEIDNGMLKLNQEYKNAMLPVGKIINTMETVTKSFSYKRNGYKLEPSDATFAKTKSFFNVAGEAKKIKTEGALKKAQEMFPDKPDILEDIELGQIAARTEGGQAAGSRNIIQGMSVGGILGYSGGGVMWPIVGATLGAIKDKFGRKVGKYTLSGTQPIINYMDNKLNYVIEKIGSERAGRFGEVTGRVLGVENELPREQSLLPQKNNYSLFPK